MLGLMTDTINPQGIIVIIIVYFSYLSFIRFIKNGNLSSFKEEIYKADDSIQKKIRR